jgi:two-component system response regulator FlrC
MSMNNSAVLIVEDDPHLREALLETLADDSVSAFAASSGLAALEILNKEDIGLVVSDLQMEPMDGATLLRTIHRDHPTLPTVLMTAYGTIENAVDTMRGGACDYLVKPFPAEQLKEVVARFLHVSADSERPVAADPRSIELLRVAKRVAQTEATVTISGESGCGKEVLARYIHSRSARADEAFVAINCAAIPESMLEAVLFGYEKGAFTGATAAHPGKFEQANNGTLLLDEVSEMDIGLQAKLLRVIQEMEVERIGGRELIPLNVRVLATTNRDLKQFVADGKFREDLYYRLNVFPLTIPALRERPADIVPLAELFIGRLASRGVELTAGARQKLMAHAWPGNVRELDNLIQRTLILNSGSLVEAGDLAFENDSIADQQRSDASALQQDLSDREYQLILDALSASNGRRGIAADALGISPRTLRYKLARMREHGITIPGDSHE